MSSTSLGKGSLSETLNPSNRLLPTDGRASLNTSHLPLTDRWLHQNTLCPPGVQTIGSAYVPHQPALQAYRNTEQKWVTKSRFLFQTTVIKELTVRCGFDSLLLLVSCHLCPLVDWNSRLNGKKKMDCIFFSLDSLFVFVFYVSSGLFIFFLFFFDSGKERGEILNKSFFVVRLLNIFTLYVD